MTTRWREDKFEDSVATAIQRMGGRSDKIENKRHPGNSDLLYSMGGRMGVLELKSTAYFNRERKIRLKHPLSDDQRKFLKEHGKRSSQAFVFVLLSDGVADNTAILFRWSEVDSLLDREPVEVCRMLASWSGPWPCKTEQEIRSLYEVLTGCTL